MYIGKIDPIKRTSKQYDSESLGHMEHNLRAAAMAGLMAFILGVVVKCTTVPYVP